MKRAACLVGDGVDCVALGAAVVVVDPVALIVASDQPGPHELGDGTADVGPAGLADPLADLSVDDPPGRVGVQRERALRFELLAHLVRDRASARVALRDWHQRVA